jgi:hypothetical protein
MDKNQARVQPYPRGMDLAHSLIQSLDKIDAGGKCEWGWVFWELMPGSDDEAHIW